MIKGIKFTKYEMEDGLFGEVKRYLDAELQFDSEEDAEDFLEYLETRKNNEWFGCMEEFDEESKTMQVHTTFKFGEMKEKKQQLKDFWYDYCA